MKRKKKWMAIVLMISMILTMLPMTTFAAESNTKEVYIDLVEQGTENLFEGAELDSAYYAHSEENVEVPFEKVSEGRWALTIDVANYADDFVICEFTFPEGYRQVGYDIEPIGSWVSLWAEREGSYVVEVCSTESGYGTSSFTVYDIGDEIYLEDVKMTATLYKDADEMETETVEFKKTTTGELLFDYEYENGMFVYEGETYKDLLVYVEFPFGYTQVNNMVENYSSLPLWYTPETIVGHTIVEILAKQYLEDLTVTTKDVYVEFVDERTGETFTDIELLEAYYIDTSTHDHNEAPVVKEEAGLFKLSLDGKTYQNETIWMYFECPEGYVFEGLDETIWADYVDRWFVNGEKITVNVCKEVYGTEPTEETFTYEFLDSEKFSVVPGTSVVISLCNEMESDDKVVIAETTTGEGEFTISHKGDFYYYNDNVYTYLEISYRFPEGYILADSENITENTVWYSVENICDGGNGIIWFLEKVNKDESEDTTNDIKDVIVEDTDTSKEVTEKLDNVIKESQKGDKVKVEVPKETNVGKDAFETAKEKEVAVIIVSNKNEKNDYVQWDFETIDNPVEFNPTVHVDAKVEEIEKKLEHFEMPKNCKHTVVSFEFAGVLPGKAKVTLDMEDTGLEIETLEEDKLVYLYFFNPETKAFELIDSSKVLEGYVTFSMTHCSDYIVTTELLEDNMDDDQNGINVPNTGDNAIIGLYGFILLLGVGCILMTKKRNMME